MVSIVDVAQRAQVGTSTVSRVLSGKGYVSDATRRKVMEAVEALDYAPNELARNLLRNRTFIIGVIVPDISNYYFSTLVNEIEPSCATRDTKPCYATAWGVRRMRKRI